jgi:hypothetical protein
VDSLPSWLGRDEAENWAEGQEMISWRPAVLAVVAAAAVAWCITYFVSPAPPQRIEADQRMLATETKASHRQEPAPLSVQAPSNLDDVTAYQRAAEAILKRAQNAKASADEQPLVTGRIPLPKRRPLPRP